ncbi:A-kinase-interacting protein 1 isoform X2 [Heterocephalus glaber]|uniref:A-kinase-interacting protein 1 isoform X2 n=1 Tax=Heterocephalus glaber TaxID=10181 RepID=A0AAX6TFI7_HETGA|nr:A-kinase-interacting protein 1 isoform X2 [Heterocephalus glaber]
MAGRAGAARYKPPPSQDLWARAPREAGRANMENCLAAAALNGLDRRSLQRSARLGQEVLERARRRAVDWHLQERPTGSMGVLSREGPCREGRRAADPRRFLPTEREERHLTLNASFRIMAEFMDYTSSQCGKYYSSVPEEGGATHVYRYHRGKSQQHVCSNTGYGQAENISKDLYIEVYPGTYSVTVASNALTKKTHVVAVDSGQSVDLVFPV